MTIHHTAIIDKSAEIDSSVTVGPYAIIGPHVKIAKNTQVHSHALIQGHTTIGENNQIFSFSSVGNPPQDLKYKGENTVLEIGNGNIIREYVTIQPGTVQGGGMTKVGNENLLMAYSHVAHDCMVGNKIVMANGVQLAGHVTVCDMAVLGGLTAVHQFVVIGEMSMTSGGTIARQDIPPFCTASGNPSYLYGLNLVALQRRNVSPAARKAIKNVYKNMLLKQHATIDLAIESLAKEDLNYLEVQLFVEFIKNSKRGITRPEISAKTGDSLES